jgi:hypothetical protein
MIWIFVALSGKDRSACPRIENLHRDLADQGEYKAESLPCDNQSDVSKSDSRRQLCTFALPRHRTIPLDRRYDKTTSFRLDSLTFHDLGFERSVRSSPK